MQDLTKNFYKEIQKRRKNKRDRRLQFSINLLIALSILVSLLIICFGGPILLMFIILLLKS